MVEAFRQTPQAAAPAPDQLKRIEAGLLADLKPVKPMPPAGLFFFALLFIAALIAVVGGEELGFAGWEALGPVRRSLLFGTLAAFAALLAFSAGRQIVPGSRLVVRPSVAIAAVWALMAGLFAILFQPHEELTFVATGLMCLRIGLEFAMPAGVLSWLLLRRGAILNPALTGATAGAFAGLSGLTVLEIFCPNPNVYHILVWHLAAAVGSTLGGLAIGTLAEYFGRRR